MKTKLIEELHKAPVEELKHRVASPIPQLEVVERSDSASVRGPSFESDELYSVTAKFRIEFVSTTRDSRDARNYRYERCMRSLTEAVYGDVRAEVHGLVGDLMHLVRQDFETHEKVMARIDKILEMTEP